MMAIILAVILTHLAWPALAADLGPFPTCELDSLAVEIRCNLMTNNNNTIGNVLLPRRDYSSNITNLNRLELIGVNEIPNHSFWGLQIRSLLLTEVEFVDHMAFQDMIRLQSLTVIARQRLTKPSVLNHSLVFIQNVTSSLSLINVPKASFSSQLKGFTQLTSLTLANNGLIRLNASFLKRNPMLFSLNISNQHIGAQLYVGGLPKLTLLTLDDNEIPYLDNTVIDQLPELYMLNLENNQIQSISIDFFSAFPSLKLVYLTNNRIRSIAQYYPNQITKLAISNNFLGIDSAPISFSMFMALTELNLRNNSVANISLPNSVVDVDLSYNQLNDLHLAGYHNLVHIRAINNHLYSASIINNANLKEINLDYNQIEAVEVKDLPKLFKLTLDYNHFDYTNNISITGCPGIKELSMTGNGLQILDRQFFHDLKQLVDLNLDNNAVREIDPYCFWDNVELAFLGLSRNFLYQVPPVTTLANLKILDLSDQHGQLTSIQDLAFERAIGDQTASSLTVILSKNYILDYSAASFCSSYSYRLIGSNAELRFIIDDINYMTNVKCVLKQLKDQNVVFQTRVNVNCPLKAFAAMNGIRIEDNKQIGPAGCDSYLIDDCQLPSKCLSSSFYLVSQNRAPQTKSDFVEKLTKMEEKKQETVFDYY